jgi:hypothetical protein
MIKCCFNTYKAYITHHNAYCGQREKTMEDIESEWETFLGEKVGESISENEFDEFLATPTEERLSSNQYSIPPPAKSDNQQIAFISSTQPIQRQSSHEDQLQKFAQLCAQLSLEDDMPSIIGRPIANEKPSSIASGPPKYPSIADMNRTSILPRSENNSSRQHFKHDAYAYVQSK